MFNFNLNDLKVYLGYIGTLVINVIDTFKNTDWNILFVTLTSLAVFIYTLMRIYDQYLITKKRKEEERKNNE